MPVPASGATPRGVAHHAAQHRSDRPVIARWTTPVVLLAEAAVAAASGADACPLYDAAAAAAREIGGTSMLRRVEQAAARAH